MYGLKAISEANGWIISLAGISIVYTGLIILVALISNLERALTLWDRKHELLRPILKAFSKEQASEYENGPASSQPRLPATSTRTDQLSSESREVAYYFEMIAQRLGEPFSLLRLLEQAERRGVPKPHSHLALFIEHHLVEEDTENHKGFYRWKKTATPPLPRNEASSTP